MKLTFHTEDLTQSTLRAIRDDMAKYAHLAMYKQTWLEINQALKNRDYNHQNEREELQSIKQEIEEIKKKEKVGD